MSTVLTWQTTSMGAEETLALAEQIGRKLRGGEAIELVSDLGGGKTTFVHGLAAGLKSYDVVHSPSFTLSNEYRGNKLTLQHFDFYRLSKPGIMRDELAEILTDPKNVVAVEWADIVEDILPAERLTVRMQTTGETTRQIIFDYPESLRYLVPKA